MNIYRALSMCQTLLEVFQYVLTNLIVTAILIVLLPPLPFTDKYTEDQKV